MSRFVQLHLLTSYPPSNLNRDDTGRPKTAVVGDALRLRISSQSLKRAWRTSTVFAEHLPDAESRLGKRTKLIGSEWIYTGLLERGVDEDKALAWSIDLQRAFGEPEDESGGDPKTALQNKQLVHVAPAEKSKLMNLLGDVSNFVLNDVATEAVASINALRDRRDKVKEADKRKKANAALAKHLAEMLLVKDCTAVDVAMFGRMLAASPSFNFEAAVQVAHAITVHKAAVEDDYFSAVDDLNRKSDMGAAHIDGRGYGAGLFYLYVCIDRELLAKNLGDDAALTRRALQALVDTVTKVSPTGMQNSFASRAYAGYVLAEKGKQQPRSLAQAFLKPVKPHEGEGMLEKSVTALQTRCKHFDAVYGACAEGRYVMDVETPEGSIQGLIDFVTA